MLIKRCLFQCYKLWMSFSQIKVDAFLTQQDTERFPNTRMSYRKKRETVFLSDAWCVIARGSQEEEGGTSQPTQAGIHGNASEDDTAVGIQIACLPETKMMIERKEGRKEEPSLPFQNHFLFPPTQARKRYPMTLQGDTVYHLVGDLLQWGAQWMAAS